MRPALLVVTTLAIVWGVTREARTRVVVVPVPTPLPVLVPSLGSLPAVGGAAPAAPRAGSGACGDGTPTPCAEAPPRAVVPRSRCLLAQVTPAEGASPPGTPPRGAPASTEAVMGAAADGTADRAVADAAAKRAAADRAAADGTADRAAADAAAKRAVADATATRAAADVTADRAAAKEPCDDGLPALAGDTFAVAVVAVDDLTGATTAAIEWRDVRTTRLVRRLPIADERDVARAERLLAGYRALVAAGEAGLRVDRDPDTEPATARLRVVDTAANALLLEDEHGVAAGAYGLRGAAISEVAAWFDAERRLLLGVLTIGDGHGPEVAAYFARTLPRP